MIYTLTVPAGRDQMLAFGKTILTSCRVRNLENGGRGRGMVVWSENRDGSRGKPYSPQIFPQGIWDVGRPEAVDPKVDTHRYMQPFFIPTNAHQEVSVWEAELTDHWRYVMKTTEVIEDGGYGIHYSESEFTLGCLKVESRDDLLWLVEEIKKVQKNGDQVKLALAATYSEGESE